MTPWNKQHRTPKTKTETVYCCCERRDGVKRDKTKTKTHTHNQPRTPHIELLHNERRMKNDSICWNRTYSNGTDKKGRGSTAVTPSLENQTTTIIGIMIWRRHEWRRQEGSQTHTEDMERQQGMRKCPYVPKR